MAVTRGERHLGEGEALRNLRTEFLKQPERPFFFPDRRRKSKLRAGPDRRIVELRKRRNMSVAEIAAT